MLCDRALAQLGDGIGALLNQVIKGLFVGALPKAVLRGTAVLEPVHRRAADRFQVAAYERKHLGPRVVVVAT